MRYSRVFWPHEKSIPETIIAPHFRATTKRALFQTDKIPWLKEIFLQVLLKIISFAKTTIAERTIELQLEGIVRELLPIQEGEGRNGKWRKQQFILETPGNYTKQICIMVWGDRIDQFSLNVGETIKAFIDIESREFNGRWYTDVKAWKIEKNAPAANTPPQEANYGEPFPAAPVPSTDTPAQNSGSDPFSDDQEDDGLPF